MTSSFSVYKRENPHHWDINGKNAEGTGLCRHWRIRGEHGRIIVHDERPNTSFDHRHVLEFKTVATAMAFIADHYMMEGVA